MIGHPIRKMTTLKIKKIVDDVLFLLFESEDNLRVLSTFDSFISIWQINKFRAILLIAARF